MKRSRGRVVACSNKERLQHPMVTNVVVHPVSHGYGFGDGSACSDWSVSVTTAIEIDKLFLEE
jgi:hypothetical protein